MPSIEIMPGTIGIVAGHRSFAEPRRRYRGTPFRLATPPNAPPPESALPAAGGPPDGTTLPSGIDPRADDPYLILGIE